MNWFGLSRLICGLLSINRTPAASPGPDRGGLARFALRAQSVAYCAQLPDEGDTRTPRDIYRYARAVFQSAVSATA
jgi:hypothetical protein